jgi:hypothetical protein
MHVFGRGDGNRADEGWGTQYPLRLPRPACGPSAFKDLFVADTGEARSLRVRMPTIKSLTLLRPYYNFNLPTVPLVGRGDSNRPDGGGEPNAPHPIASPGGWGCKNQRRATAIGPMEGGEPNDPNLIASPNGWLDANGPGLTTHRCPGGRGKGIGGYGWHRSY